MTPCPAREATLPNSAVAPKSNECEVVVVGWVDENHIEAEVLVHICI